MTERQSVESVRLECPLCPWVSATEPVVEGRPNALWHAKALLMGGYRYHFDTTHRPLPRVVQIDGSGAAS